MRAAISRVGRPAPGAAQDAQHVVLLQGDAARLVDDAQEAPLRTSVVRSQSATTPSSATTRTAALLDLARRDPAAMISTIGSNDT